jgi:hypothetical protein
VIVIHGTELDDVHAHPAAAVTETDPVRALAEMDRLVGEMVNVQPEAWVMENVCPAIVIVPVRAVVSVLAVTE